MRSSFDKECAFLSTLEHPHIVRMFECFQEKEALYIVMEYCRGGDLYARMVADANDNTSAVGLGEPQSRLIFKQMLLAASYLHAQNIVHRDIKTENLLFAGEQDTPQGNLLKLCDFGTSSRLSNSKLRSFGNSGTPSYTAPEVYALKGASRAADCWSLGVVLYMLLTGSNPFMSPGESNFEKKQIVKRIRRGAFEQRRPAWNIVSELGKDLVKRLMVLDEAERLTCEQAMGHQWITQAESSTLLCCTPGSLDCSSLARFIPELITLLQHLQHLSIAQRSALASCAIAAQDSDLEAAFPWRELFFELDTDCDGRISCHELICGLQRLLAGSSTQLPDEQLKACAEALDLDQSGHIEWLEWVVLGLLGSRLGTSKAAEPVATAFRLLSNPAPADVCLGKGQEQAQSLSQLIHEWVKEADIEVGGTLTLADLRFVVATTEIRNLL